MFARQLESWDSEPGCPWYELIPGGRTKEECRTGANACHAGTRERAYVSIMHTRGVRRFRPVRREQTMSSAKTAAASEISREADRSLRNELPALPCIWQREKRLPRLPERRQQKAENPCVLPDQNLRHAGAGQDPVLLQVRFFPCIRLTHLDKRYRANYGMSMIDNLETIQGSG